MSAPRTAPLRLLIVDDSPFNRRLLAGLFDGDPAVEVVGAAADGEEALRLIQELTPDALTLDLEMPKMDGFTLLRLLMAKRPLPVLVVSSYAQRENVLRALELGAVDFVPKPEQTIPADAHALFAVLREKVHALATIDRSRLLRKATFRRSLPSLGDLLGADGAPAGDPLLPPKRVVVVAAGTGGPAAVLTLWDKLPATTGLALVVCQQMPEKFTKAFADRLSKRGTIGAVEADDGVAVVRGQGYVAPGDRSLGLAIHEGRLVLRHLPSEPGERTPVADRLFSSAAQVLGPRAVGVVLTGMGEDGAEGARLLRERGAPVFVEDPAQAVVPAMPLAALAKGAGKAGTLDELGEWLAQLGT